MDDSVVLHLSLSRHSFAPSPFPSGRESIESVIRSGEVAMSKLGWKLTPSGVGEQALPALESGFRG